MGQRMLIAFIPQKKVVDKVSKVRKSAGIKIEKTSGLKTPHITLIENSYSNVKDVDKKLKEISKSFNSFSVKIKGFDTFVVNKKLKIERYKQNNSLVYMFENNSSMNKFRKELIKKLNPLQTEERIEQWEKQNPTISKKGLSNIKKYGTPFGLREWKFHTTIGLIPKTKQKDILKKIKKLNIQEDVIINHVGLFLRKGTWKLFKKYNFR